ncbi:MAG: acyl-CoA dehydratase activase-related protein [bacterium]
MYLGIDIGSISTNLVLLDENAKVIAKRYLATAGRPIEAVKKGLAEIQQEVGEVEILGVGTTGSGRYMIGDLVGADIVKNEITAQATAAIHFNPQVDTIFEIGGQDSKYISLTNGVIIDFSMNKVCAAGTGSFLEEQAEKLGINIKEEFAQLAEQATTPTPLGDRCTVFIESELNNQLQKGVSRNDLIAGLAVSIVKNYLNKVVETRAIGTNIMFQGGVAYNQAVVKAFQIVTNKEIIVPPHHEVTGSIGIALIAQKERTWSKSKFKGFALGQKKHETKSFECKSCANLCEINMITVADEDPIFFGGRCEKWEMSQKQPSTRYPIPNLFKERDEIIFAQKETAAGKKKIGIPRVLFFYERFPFWQAFFSALGLDVVLSSSSNQQIVNESLENTPTEACFPITLIHGHILELIKTNPDFIFLPSLINMEKASEKFNESFNCPFVQALPYFAKTGLNIKQKILSPALEPQRGKKYFHRQLIKLGGSLGQNRQTCFEAVKKAEHAQEKAKRKLKHRGQQILALIEKENIPALAIISRPYNGSDQILNLDIPKKLRDMGVLAIPADMLPSKRADIAAEFPNMYWNYGQKMLAAAKFIGQQPKLHALHISNFRCGPDSFITHLLKDIFQDKPFLQIEVDEHSSDTGVITRLEAFLDSLSNNAAKAQRRKGTKAIPKLNKNRTIYLPLMSDHAVSLAAAIRSCGIDSEVLPPSDNKTLELGRQYSSGKECHPYIVTTGDFIKKILEKGFRPNQSAFFMPSASGPCRFGNYHQVQRLLFKRLGHEDIPLISPDAKDAYSKSMGLDLNFRRRAWQGMVAVDLLAKLIQEKRPNEKNKGETDELHAFYLNQISKAVESGNGKLIAAMKDVRNAFAAIPQNPNGHKPVIGIVGEIYLRCNPACNGDIVRRLETLGGRAWTAPLTEWSYYTNLGYMYESLMRKNPGHLLQALLIDLTQKWDEHRLSKVFRGTIKNLHEPSIIKTLKHAAPYLHYSYKGEAALSLGKAVDYIQKGASGIINIMPFTCMPGTVVSALSKRLRQDHGDFPWLDLSIDGNEGVNLDTRLEAFIHQAKAKSSLPRQLAS